MAWLSGADCFQVDFSGSMRERGFVPVLCMDLDDVRGVRRPSRVEAQAPGADFEFANSRSFLAQVVAQGAAMAACFTCEAIAYVASEKDSEIHDFIVEFWFSTVATPPVVSLANLRFRAN